MKASIVIFLLSRSSYITCTNIFSVSEISPCVLSLTHDSPPPVSSRQSPVTTAHLPGTHSRHLQVLTLISHPHWAIMSQSSSTLSPLDHTHPSTFLDFWNQCKNSNSTQGQNSRTHRHHSHYGVMMDYRELITLKSSIPILQYQYWHLYMQYCRQAYWKCSAT